MFDIYIEFKLVHIPLSPTSDICAMCICYQ